MTTKSTVSRSTHGWNREVVSTPRTGMALGLCIMQLILAYEWLISGVNKLLDPNFTIQLPGMLEQSMHGNPYGWYVNLLRLIVLPHATLFGLAAELGELAVGASLTVSALLWIWRPHSRLATQAGTAACFSLLGGSLLCLSYFFQNGTPLPGINTASAFNEGMTIDMLIPLLSLALLGTNLQAIRLARREAAGVSRAKPRLLTLAA